jgi:hypothetical protein
MQTCKYNGLAYRAEEIVKTKIYITGFISILKKFIVNGIGIRVEEKINDYRWSFSLFGQDDNLILSVNRNGITQIYSQKPLDYLDENDRLCVNLFEYLVGELINQRVTKLQLEKILFQLL